MSENAKTKTYPDPRFREMGQKAREVGAFLAQQVREGKPIAITIQKK